MPEKDALPQRRVKIAMLVSGTLFASPALAGPYAIRLHSDASVDLVVDGHAERFRPEFTVVRANRDPAMALSRAESDPRQRKAGVDSPDAFRVPAWAKPAGGRSDVLFDAGASDRIVATSARREGDVVRWSFPERPGYTLEATLTPAPGDLPPVLAFRLTPKQAGWWSVGYTGAPSFDPARLTELWQPLVWQERRFPRAPLLTPEAIAPTPITSVTRGGWTVGVAPDPAESPFRLPTLADSRFGLMLRNREARAQPMIWAPVLGTPASRLEAGRATAFRLRPLVVRGSRHDAAVRVARELFGFRDLRRNVDRSLNEVIDNFVRFAMNDDYAGWNAELKGFGYDTDAFGSVKNVSALHPLSLSIIRDDPEIYARRALPMTEYLLSREKYLFAVDRRQQTQGASSRMAGPGAEVAEFAGLDAMTGGRNPVLRRSALSLVGQPRALNLDMINDGRDFRSRLALYRATGDRAQLAAARREADAYIARRIDRPATDMSDVQVERGGQFWSDFAPKWVDLFELWEETSERRYLDAAAAGARLHAAYAWTWPSVPAGDVVADRGGAAPVAHFSFKNSVKTGMATPEQTVPAWVLSMNGLVPEASTTAEPNPGVLLAHHAAWFLRIAAATGDTYFRDLARWAVVGRYTTYPGYDINGRFSQVYARADYPYRPLSDLTYNEIYYNHVWPHIALLVDYLVSDVETRTKGAVRFPSRFAAGYAYLTSKVYGDRPGEFFGHRSVRLWMPEALVESDDPQINYVAGRGNGNLYLALSNQSPEPRRATLMLNRDFVPVAPGSRLPVELWAGGKRLRDAELVDGRITVDVSPSGVTGLLVRGAPTFTRTPLGTARGPSGFDAAETPFGRVSSAVLRHAGRADAHVWLSSGADQVTAATLTAVIDGKTRTLTDRSFPFEWSVSLPPGAARVTMTVQAETPTGRRSGPAQRIVQ